MTDMIIKPSEEMISEKAAANAVDTKKLPKNKIYDTYTTNTDSNVRRIPFGMITVVFFLTIMALFVAYLSVRVNEMNTEIADLNSSLASIREQTADAKAALAEKKDITEIRRAAEAYGMVRAETLPSHYVSVESEEEILVLDDSAENEELSFLSLMSAFRDSISSFIEYLR